MILGMVEHAGGAVNELSLQMLALGRSLARQTGDSLHAVMIGDDAAPLCDRLGAHGVSTVHVASEARLADYAPEAWAACVVDVITRLQPQAVLAAGTERGHEVLAHVAARTDLPLAANCTEVRPADSGYEVTRQRWGGSLLEEARLSAATRLLTVAPHAFAAAEIAVAGPPSLEPFSPGLDERDFRVQVVGRVEPDRDTISLADAKVVVGGGRGVGSSEGFAVLEEIAALLGGAVGCSRAVTSLGWRPHSDQVGQTGTRIAPDVYIACGISGAIQHMVGCKSAKCLVAINKDPEAPIIAQSDYAIIGDAQQVLPALRDALRSQRSRSE